MRAVALAAVMVLGSMVTGGCGDEECSGDCGGGLVVGWEVRSVPDADRHRICVDGDCETVEPDLEEGSDPPYAVALGSAFPDGPVEVTLEALRSDGTVLASYRGSGDRTAGGCCPALRMEVDGARLVERP